MKAIFIVFRLRKQVINVNFMKGGELLYTAATYPGYVGVFTGMKPHKFTMTMNQRFDLKDGGYKSLVTWLMGEPTNFDTFFAR